MRFYILGLLLLVAFCFSSCKNNYYPPNDGLSEEKYKYYSLELDTAYMLGDNYEISLQLANLNANPEMVHEHLKLAIRENEEVCFDLFDFNKVYKEHGFKVNLISLDTTLWNQTFNICKRELGEQAFDEYYANKLFEVEQKKASRKPLDSSLFDKNLIQRFRRIHQDDQKYRYEIMNSEEDKNKLKELWKKQNQIDEGNLVEITAILDSLGTYPEPSLISYEMLPIPWLVLHHSANIEMKEKYQGMLEESVRNGHLNVGCLNGYKKRIQLMKMDKI